MSEHYLSTKSTHDRWNRDLEPQIEVGPGDVVKFDCFDSSDGPAYSPGRQCAHGYYGRLAAQDAAPLMKSPVMGD
jgi:acetamidase/formamidase